MPALRFSWSFHPAGAGEKSGRTAGRRQRSYRGRSTPERCALRFRLAQGRDSVVCRQEQVRGVRVAGEGHTEKIPHFTLVPFGPPEHRRDGRQADPPTRRAPAARLSGPLEIVKVVIHQDPFDRVQTADVFQVMTRPANAGQPAQADRGTGKPNAPGRWSSGRDASPAKGTDRRRNPRSSSAPAWSVRATSAGR